MRQGIPQTLNLTTVLLGGALAASIAIGLTACSSTAGPTPAATPSAGIPSTLPAPAQTTAADPTPDPAPTGGCVYVTKQQAEAASGLQLEAGTDVTTLVIPPIVAHAGCGYYNSSTIGGGIGYDINTIDPTADLQAYIAKRLTAIQGDDSGAAIGQFGADESISSKVFQNSVTIESISFYHGNTEVTVTASNSTTGAAAVIAGIIQAQLH